MTEEARRDRVMRFAEIWWKSRRDAGVSQEHMALSLGVSKKTIQNWEKGISSPDLFEANEWFRILGVNKMHYILALYYPAFFRDIDIENAEDTEVEEALIKVIKTLSHTEMRQLLFLLTGDHGSDPMAVINLAVAHYQTPLQHRITLGHVIVENYLMAEKLEGVICPDDVKPNMQVVCQSLVRAKEAVFSGKKSYNIN